MKSNKRLIMFFITTIISSTGMMKAEDNLLKNGSFEKVKPFCPVSEDFENAKPFIGWNCLGGWLNNISVSREAKYGNTSVLFTSPCWITRSVKVKENTKYAVTGYIRTALQKVPEATDLGAYFEIKSGKKILLRRSISGIHNWTKLSGEFIVPGGEKWVKINIGLKNTTGYCWVDGFKITEKTGNN